MTEKHDENLGPRLAYSVSEAGQLIGISRRKMFDLVRDRRVRSIKLDGRRLIRHIDLEQYLADLAEAS